MQTLKKHADSKECEQDKEKSDDGKVIAMDIKVGDIVVYTKYGGTEIKVDDEEYMILRASDILAKKGK